MLAHRSELGSLSGNIYPLSPREGRYELNALLFDASEAQAEARLPALPGEVSRTRDQPSYLDHCLQVDRLLESLASSGGWNGLAHPWFDAFLPDSRFEGFLSEVLPTLDPALDVGPANLGALAQIHVFLLLTRHMQKPLLRVPDEPLVYLFDILTSAYGPGSSAEYRSRMLSRNQALFARARALGGTRYNIAALPMTSAMWAEELGGAFQPFALQKRHHDPRNILGWLTESH